MLHTGKLLNGSVDHVNGVRDDNRISNLRIATPEDNARNKKQGALNKSGSMGVYWVKADRKWRVRIGVNGKYVSVGVFSNLEDALEARKTAEIKYGYHENHGRAQ